MSEVDMSGDYKENYSFIGKDKTRSEHTLYMHVAVLAKCAMCPEPALYLMILYDTRNHSVDRSMFCEKCIHVTLCFAQKIATADGTVVTGAGKGQCALIAKENSES